MSAQTSSYFRTPLNTILAREGAVRVLRELYMQGEPLSAPALAERTHLSHVGVLKVLQALTETRIIRALGSGRSILYELDSSHPFASVLRPMFIREHERVQTILEDIRRVVREVDPAPVSVWAYGSVARGDDTPDSDFDLAVVVRDGDEVEDVANAVREGLRSISDAQDVTFSVMGLSMSDIERLGDSRDLFWVNVEQDAISLAGLRPREALREARRAVGSSREGDAV